MRFVQSWILSETAERTCATSPQTMLRRGVGALAVGGAGFAAYKALAPKGEEKDFGGGPLKKKIQRFNSLVERGQNPQEIKTRAEMIKSLKAGELFDVIIVGAGCTGAGTALDCAARGLKTACIERGDFSNETSSRSSKLIWGGFKYLQVAFAELLNRRTLYEPISSVQKFWGEFLMVYECCQERTWLAGQQPHLVEYVPQAVRGSSPAHGGISFSAEPAAGPAPPPLQDAHARLAIRLARLQVPFKNLVQWPPYFDHPFYSILPILAVPAFLFYDALARCAPCGPW